jgi:hypothetical protein
MSRHNKAKRLWHSAGSDRTGTLEKGNGINVWRIAELWYPAYRFLIIVCILGLNPALLFSDVVAVRHREGFGHGFLTFKNSEGQTLAVGEEIDTVQGDQVKTHLRFVFKDGSIYEETTLFSQSRTFRLISDHVVQKGPAFRHGMESTIDADAGQVRVHSNDENGKEKDVSEKIDLPADLANGMVSVLLKNIGANAPKTSFSLVSTTSKPRVVKLVITSLGDESFSVAGFGRKATHYVIKIEIGGIAGVIAPISGKQPPERHMWIYGREVPTMVKFEGPLCEDGPSGQIVPTGPEWPHQSSPGKR